MRMFMPSLLFYKITPNCLLVCSFTRRKERSILMLYTVNIPLYVGEYASQLTFLPAFSSPYRANIIVHIDLSSYYDLVKLQN